MPPTKASSPTRTEIFFRLVKEFWLPASIAAAWTVYVIWGGVHDVKAVVGTFVTTLFFVSWFTGQIFRVSKQSAVDKNLRMIEGRLTNLLGRVEEGTKELIAQMTGGDSICDVQFVDPNETNTRFLMSAGVRGKYALREVSINIIDVGELEKISEALAIRRELPGFHVLRGGLINPGYSILCPNVGMGDGNSVHAKVIVTSLNGQTCQWIEMRLVEGKWRRFTTIGNHVLEGGKSIFRHMDAGFPIEELAALGWDVSDFWMPIRSSSS